MLKKEIRIKCISSEACEKTMRSIHEQLVGNEDYINSNIILNDSETRRDETVNEIHLLFFEECENVPSIVID